jgi:hypothetical protein
MGSFLSLVRLGITKFRIKRRIKSHIPSSLPDGEDRHPDGERHGAGEEEPEGELLVLAMGNSYGSRAAKPPRTL